MAILRCPVMKLSVTGCRDREPDRDIFRESVTV